MRNRLAVLVLAALVACSSKPSAPPVVERSFRLDNGLRVELRAKPCGERAAVVVLLDVGTDHDPPGQSGMALLVGRLLAGPTGTVETGRGYTLYSTVVAKGQLAAELDAIAERIASSDVDADVDMMRRVWLGVAAQLTEMRGGDPTKTAMSFAAESLQPTRGGGWRPGGIDTETELRDVTVDEVQVFWNRHVKPGNARLLVAGRFDADAIRTRIETAFTLVEAGTPPEARAPADATVTGTLVMGTTPSALAIAIPAPAPADPRHPAFLILVARLLGPSPLPAREWQVHYDPILRPEILFLTGPLHPGEQPDAAAMRVRGEVTTHLWQPLAPRDVAVARTQFADYLGLRTPARASCDEDPRPLAVAEARRAQLGLDKLPLAQALEATTPPQLTEAAMVFDRAHSAAVVAGGEIR